MTLTAVPTVSILIQLAPELCHFQIVIAWKGRVFVQSNYPPNVDFVTIFLAFGC